MTIMIDKPLFQTCTDGTLPATNSDKVYELKTHSWFKEVGKDKAPGMAGSAGIAIPRRKQF